MQNFNDFNLSSTNENFWTLWNQCAHIVSVSIFANSNRSPRSSKPSMNSFVRGRSCLFLPRIPGVLFHSVSRKHFLYGTIFRRNLNEMEFLVERNKKIKRRYDKNLEEITEEYIFSFLIIIIISLKRWYSTKMNILDYFPYFRQIPWKLL